MTPGTTDRRRLWLILLSILVALGVAMWLLPGRGLSDGTAGGDGEPGVDSPTGTPADDSLTALVADNRDATGACQLEPAGMAEGLRRLAAALGTNGMAGDELMVRLRSAAEHVLLSPASAEVATTVRQALVDAAGTFSSTDPGGTVRTAAEHLRPELALTGQAADVCLVFDAASQVIAARPAERK